MSTADSKDMDANSNTVDTNTVDTNTDSEDSRRRRYAILIPITVAVVGLAAVAVLEDAPTRHGIEANLTSRSAHALAGAGLTGVHVTFAGRDGTIYAPTSEDGSRALVIVTNLNGVRTAKVVVTSQPSTAVPTPTVTLSVAPSPSPVPSESTTPSPVPSGSPATPATPADVQKQLDALNHIEFATGSSALTATSRAVIVQVAAILQANPTIGIRIEGNTDSVGATSMNLTLSRARAKSVEVALQALGIAGSRMTMIGYGESHPKVPNTSAANRTLNRRVDIAVVS